MRPWILLAVLLLAVPALSGCVDTLTKDDPTEGASDRFQVAWHEKALPWAAGHDHENRSQHRGLSTPNWEVLGYSPLNSTYYGAPAGAYFCGDAQPVEDGRRLAAVESRSEVGFALADVSDPADPRWLGELVMPTTHIYDLAVAPTGNHVVLVTSEAREAAPSVPLARTQQAASPSPGLAWRSACTGGELVPVQVAMGAGMAEDPTPRPMSVVLVDISDPSQPTITEQQPLLGSGHSVFSTRVDGTDWVMVTTTRVPGPVGIPRVNENGISFYEFYRLNAGAAQGTQLELVSTWKQPTEAEQAVPEDPTGGPVDLGPRGHDGWLAPHPVSGELVAYLAGGDRFTILDMSDPANPAELGRWTVAGPGTPAEEGTLHTTWPLSTTWNGSHYTVVGPEHAGHPEGVPSGIIWVLDTTDPADPHPVAAWTLPAEVNWNGTYMFSNHYVSVVDQTLFVSMYHGGVWAVDLSTLTDGQATPAGNASLELLDSIGVYLPDRDPPTEAAVQQRWAPTVEEILAMPDGSLVTFDGNTGLYTLRFDASDPAPAPAPWPIPDPVEP